MIRSRRFKQFSPDELEELARELRSLVPRIGTEIEHHLFGRQPAFCFSYRQLDVFTSLHTAAAWLPAEQIQAIDREIVVPALRSRPDVVGVRVLATMTADWLARTASDLRAQPDDAPPWPALRASAIADLACRCWIAAAAAARVRHEMAHLIALSAPPRDFATEPQSGASPVGEGRPIQVSDVRAAALEIERLAPTLGPVLDREMFGHERSARELLTIVDLGARAFEMENGLPDAAYEQVIARVWALRSVPERTRPAGSTGALLELADVLRAAAHDVDHGTAGTAELRRDMAGAMAAVLGGCVLDAAIVARRSDLTRRLAALLRHEHRLDRD